MQSMRAGAAVQSADFNKLADSDSSRVEQPFSATNFSRNAPKEESDYIMPKKQMIFPMSANSTVAGANIVSQQNIMPNFRDSFFTSQTAHSHGNWTTHI